MTHMVSQTPTVLREIKESNHIYVVPEAVFSVLDSRLLALQQRRGLHEWLDWRTLRPQLILTSCVILWGMMTLNWPDLEPFVFPPCILRKGYNSKNGINAKCHQK